jgi:hypothetical protein
MGEKAYEEYIIKKEREKEKKTETYRTLSEFRGNGDANRY